MDVMKARSSACIQLSISDSTQRQLAQTLGTRSF